MSTSPLLQSFARTTAMARSAATDQKAFQSHQEALNARLRSEVDADFFSHWDVTPTPLTLTHGEWMFLRRRARTLFRIIEKTVQMYINGNDELDQLFGRYAFFRPYMTKRYTSWQEYGRYDFIVRTDGEPVFIETNTAMASGYLPMSHVNRCFHESAPPTVRPQGDRVLLPYDEPDSLGRHLVRMETVSGARYGSVGILVDENHKMHEADLIRRSLENVGRSVVIGDVRDLRRQGHEIFLDGHLLSTTFNKFRIFGEAHHWSAAAFSDNRVCLKAVADNNVLSVNNFAAMTVSEDKAIFAAMRLPCVQEALTPDEQAFVETNTPATYVLKPSRVVIEGREVDLVEHVRANKDRLVLKPRSDYRGSNVHSGRDCGPDAWETLVESALQGDYLVQSRVDAAFFDVTYTLDGAVNTAPMRMAGGIYFADSDFQGLVARAASWEIINAINHAHVLPVSMVIDP